MGGVRPSSAGREEALVDPGLFETGGILPGPPRCCPGCGEPSPEPVHPGGETNFFCHRCGTCWHIGMGYLWAINPLTCPGCPRSAQCRSVPTWLADSLTSVHHLADGTRVVIRPLLPGDRALTEVDDQKHLALGAFTLDEPNHRGLGVARFVRLADRPTAAEAAVTVSASHQRRGLGTLLSAQLAGAAEERGIGTFVAHVLTDNAEWLSHLRQIGAEAFRAEPGVTRVEVSLATSGREQRIHRLLRHLADPPRS